MRAIIGTGLILISMVLTAWLALNEPTRIATYDAQFHGRSIESGGQSFEAYCSACHGLQGEGSPGKGPQLFPRLFISREVQLKAAKWGGGLDDFVELTISGGRPIWSEEFGGGQFAEHMPTWSQRYGGPLRDDQIQDIVAFIMNWRGKEVPRPTVPAVDGNFPSAEPLPAGDAARGAKLFNTSEPSSVTLSALPCQACHSLAPGEIKLGPSLAGIGTRAAERIKEAIYKGKATSAEDYIHESVVLPSTYIADDNPAFKTDTGASKMPNGLNTSLSAQDLADIIAYLLTLK